MNATLWAPSAYAEAARAEIARMADVVRATDPTLPVPSCPEWTVAQLVEHTGTIHRWATEMVRDCAQERLDSSTIDLGLPTETSAYADWLAAGAEPLLAAFARNDPDAEMWAWGADKHARFWPRRMLHETTVHRVDVELAAGRAAIVADSVAADGIDELLDNLPCAEYFRPRVAKLRGDGETIGLHGRAPDEQWLIRLDPDRFHWERAAVPADATVAVRASTADLHLILYARREVSEAHADVVGDANLLARWLECSAL